MDAELERGAEEAARACPACGARRRRAAARFCATCGRGLDRQGGGDDYVPADTLRASYHLQQGRAAAELRGRLRETEAPRKGLTPMPAERNLNGASTTALAFATYAMVPYLGIIFCPGALALGGFGYLRARRAPERGGRRASAVAVVLGLVILCVQLLLWWILYKIPDWTGKP